MVTNTLTITIVTTIMITSIQKLVLALPLILKLLCDYHYYTFPNIIFLIILYNITIITHENHQMILILKKK